MNIAVFADLHGHQLLCFMVCARWEKENNARLDLILQAGDMGAFSSMETLDRATRLHAERDPEELGFVNRFRQPDPTTKSVLQKIASPLVFVRGNHEDHLWLDQLEKESVASPFPVDVYKRIYCLKSGEIYSFQKESEKIDILGIGRINPPPEERKNPAPKYIQPYESQRLAALPSGYNVDILLTHDITADPPELRALREEDRFIATRRGLRSGMPEIRSALDKHLPLYHFFGHVGGPLLEGIDTNGRTRVVKLVDLVWTKPGELPYGTFGILQWKNKAENSFSIVDAPWLQEYHSFNWHRAF